MSDYSELKRLAEEQCISSDLGMFEDHQLCENILALIAENARLSGCDKAYAEVWEKARALQSEMDELKAENEALRKDAERYRKIRVDAIISERANGQSSYYWITDIEKSSCGWGGCPEFDHETLDDAIDAMGNGELS